MSDWAVPQQSIIKYSQIFNTNDRQKTGVLTGIQARNILIQSGLTEQVLAQIWFLSDIDRDGMLTCEEFILSMHLIEMVKQGITLPTSLPPNLIPPTIRRKLSLISPTLSDKSKDTKFGINPPLSRMSSGSISSTSEVSQSPVLNLLEWNIPQPSKLKYTQLFNSVDQNRTGFLTGLQARNILINSGLSQKVLANVWNLSDIDKDGKLTCEEFVLSMHLIDLVKSGETLPLTLPLDLIPLSYRNKTHLNSSTTALSSTNQQSSSSNDTLSNCNTFEDKRKKNFEKGQAELEKRRQLLLEQQKREQEEHERKEKEEFEKKERIRLEQERRKKEELERQLQKQHEFEMQKEEERRKQQELKEAARREMERQRKIEWENQKKSEMIMSKQRVQDSLINLKAKKQKLGLEVEKVNSQLNNLKEKVEETRKKVSDAKSEIDKMRISRDTKLQEINSLKNENKKFQERHLFIEQEKKNLSLKLKNLSSMQNQNASETTEFALKSKQIRIDQLKEQLIECEKEKEIKFKDLEQQNEELNEYNKRYEEIIVRTIELQKIYDEKRKEALLLIEKSIKQAEEASKYVDFNADWGNDFTDTLGPNNLSSTTEIRYKAIYSFKGTNPDDLSLKVDDIITYVPSEKTEVGWLQGKLNEKIGWFPVSYVKLLDDLDEKKSKNNLKVTETTTGDLNVSSSNDSYAYVLYDWEGTNESHLSIKMNDKVKILDTNSDWLLGELDGKTGWIPKPYVNSNQESEYYVSLFAFESQEPGDLTFNVNEFIHVTKKDDQWWVGETIDNRKGIFPFTFVREATKSEIEALEFKKHQISSKKNSSCSESVESTPVRSSDTSKSKKSKTKKLEIVTVIANYKAVGKEQLDLQKGQLIQVRKKFDSGWWEGEIQVKGKKRQIGWFPAAYVKQLKAPGSVNDNSANNSLTKKLSNETEKVISLYEFKATEKDELNFKANEIIKVISKKDPIWWKGESEASGLIGLFPSNYVQLYNKYETNFDELFTSNEFSENTQELEYFSSDNSSFCLDKDEHEEDECESSFQNRSKQEWFTSLEQDEYKSNHLSNIENNHSDNYDLENNHLENNHLENNHLENNHLENKILLKRNSCINEFIETEHNYVNSLKLVIEVYRDVIKNSNYLTKEESRLIFLNWDSILESNQLFLNDLLRRKEYYNDELIERIGDILCLYLESNFTDKYIRFCSNQLYSIRMFELQMENNASFKREILYHNEIYKEKLNNQSFTYLILLPMQRITRYVLLIKEIVKYTPESHVDFQDCKQSLVYAKNLCSEVNTSWDLKENHERLEWINKHIKCNEIDQHIKFNSETKFCGNRKLIYYGCLINNKNNKLLLGLLFNDFFLLVRNLNKKNKIKKYSNLFICKEALENRYYIYKKPFMLNNIKVVLRESHSIDEVDTDLYKTDQFKPNIKSFILITNTYKKYIFLRAYDHHAYKKWIKLMNLTIDEYKKRKLVYDQKHISNLMQNFNFKQVIGELNISLFKLYFTFNSNYNLNAFCTITIAGNELDLEKNDFYFITKTAKFRRNIDCNDKFILNATFNYLSKILVSKESILNDMLILSVFEDSPFSPDVKICELKLSLNNIFNEYLDRSEEKKVKTWFEMNTIYCDKLNIDSKPKCYLQIKFNLK